MSSSSSRHVTYSKKTELPTRTYHITKHHFQPIVYRPGETRDRVVDVEHKTIRAGAGDIIMSERRSGPKAKRQVVIHRSATTPVVQETKIHRTGMSGPSRVIERHFDSTDIAPSVGNSLIERSIMSSGGAPGMRVERTVTSSGGPSTRVERTYTSSGGPSSHITRTSGPSSHITRTSGPSSHITRTYTSGGGPSSTVERTITRSGFGPGGTTVERSSTNSAPPPENFVNMQKSMESELNRRKTDWEGEVEKMQHSFFDMKTGSGKGSNSSAPQSGVEILTVGDSRSLFHEASDGSKIFRQKFDLHGFDTNDLSVTAEGGKLVITASREEDCDGATSTRQFNRSVDIPECVDTDQISSFLEEDGILTIEAPVDESKLPQQQPSLIHRTETREVSPEDFDIAPPGYERVIEASTTQSNNSSPASSSSFTRTRYLGPDVEETPHGRKLKTSLYIGRKYKPDDITVRLYDYKVNVDAKGEEVIGGRTSRRQFSRDVDIPGPIERDTFHAVFGDDGRLFLGGSFTGNEDHEGVRESVQADMPASGRSVNIMY